MSRMKKNQEGNSIKSWKQTAKHKRKGTKAHSSSAVKEGVNISFQQIHVNHKGVTKWQSPSSTTVAFTEGFLGMNVEQVLGTLVTEDYKEGCQVLGLLSKRMNRKFQTLSLPPAVVKNYETLRKTENTLSDELEKNHNQLELIEKEQEQLDIYINELKEERERLLAAGKEISTSEVDDDDQEMLDTLQAVVNSIETQEKTNDNGPVR